jgi:hypothetical protein
VAREASFSDASVELRRLHRLFIIIIVDFLLMVPVRTINVGCGHYSVIKVVRDV